MKICIYGASSPEIDKSYIDATYNLAYALGKNGHSLVFGAGDNGLMGAAARGFYDNGCEIIGVIPKFFNVDGVVFEGCTQLIKTDTMRTRKQKMDDLAEAFITTPGGIGTYEEFFEIITLKQLCQSKKPLVLYNINGYFEPLRALLQSCVDGKFMPKDSMKLCFFSDNIDEIISYIENYSAGFEDISALKYIKND